MTEQASRTGARTGAGQRNESTMTRSSAAVTFRRQPLRLLAGIGLGALALAGIALIHPAAADAAFDRDYYDFCLESIGQGPDYCCAQAGGVMSSDVCKDASEVITRPTITQRNLPPIIIVPGGPLKAIPGLNNCFWL